MKEEALKLVWARDVEEGQSWSNDSDEIAEMMGTVSLSWPVKIKPFWGATSEYSNR
jgi:hypothetical protein